MTLYVECAGLDTVAIFNDLTTAFKFQNQMVNLGYLCKVSLTDKTYD